MGKLLRNLALSLTLVFALGTLALGATELRAHSTAMVCNPAIGQIGTCPGEFADTAECDAECKIVIGEWSEGACFGGCCNCQI
jgi:hypothetical protein